MCPCICLADYLLIQILCTILQSDLQNQNLANAELSERIAALESMLENRKVGVGAPLIGRPFTTRALLLVDIARLHAYSAPVQYNAVCVHGRYWYAMVLW